MAVTGLMHPFYGVCAILLNGRNFMMYSDMRTKKFTQHWSIFHFSPQKLISMTIYHLFLDSGNFSNTIDLALHSQQMRLRMIAIDHN